MLETFTIDTFKDYAGSKFSIELGGTLGSMELSLAEATALGTEPAALPPGIQRVERIPFSLIFHGPMQPVMPQRIYAFTHEKIGKFEMFIVPIGPDSSGNMRYEAVFN